jgi:hypothetical protein
MLCNLSTEKSYMKIKYFHFFFSHQLITYWKHISILLYSLTIIIFNFSNPISISCYSWKILPKLTCVELAHYTKIHYLFCMHSPGGLILVREKKVKIFYFHVRLFRQEMLIGLEKLNIIIVKE